MTALVGLCANFCYSAYGTLGEVETYVYINTVVYFSYVVSVCIHTCVCGIFLHTSFRTCQPLVRVGR